MKILLLAPHPFFQERGTPIAVNLLLKALSSHGHSVDVLTYHLGSDVVHPNVAIHRIRDIGWIRSVRPGFSLRKLVCDAVMRRKALEMARGGRYDAVHAVEEAVFIAGEIRGRFGIRYVYDMDSSMPRQMAENAPLFRLVLPLMRWCERRAIRRAAAVVAVCESLAEIARKAGARKVAVLNDISLLSPAPAEARGEIRDRFDIDGVCFMYVGNLEPYQGIEMLLDAFSILLRSVNDAVLVVAGGTDRDVEKYRRKAAGMRIDAHARFIGSWPLDGMSSLFAAADVLVSPRIRGNNTPMKIYSYLDSGRPVLATDIASHTQVLGPDVALLSPPRPADFADAMAKLAGNPELRAELGRKGKALAQDKYCFEAFERTIVELYDRLQEAEDA